MWRRKPLFELLSTFSKEKNQLRQSLEATVALCRVMELGHDHIDAAARAEWTRRMLAGLTVTARIPDCKPRSCDRGLRQPSKNWKKIRQPTSIPLVKKTTLDLAIP